MNILKAKELKLKTQAELAKMLQEERAKLQDLNFKLAGAQLKNFNELGAIRKNIAKILTVLKINQ